MYSIKVLLIILFFHPLQIFSQSGIESRILRGLDAIYNFDWKRGKEIFSKMIEDYPENPVGYHYHSLIPLWFYLGSYEQAYLDTFFIFSDKALDLAKKKEKKDSLNAELANILGLIYSNRSIANARAENYVYAVWESDRMKYYFSKSLELNERFYDSHLGLGLYNLAVAQVPSSLQWAIKLVGISADREVGLEHLKKVIDRGKLARIDAMFYLSQIYTRIVIDPDNAEKILMQLNGRYPKNLLFKMSLAWVEVEKGSLDLAEKRFKSILASKENKFPLLKSLSQYQLGNIYFYKNQQDSAKVYFKEYIYSNLRNDYIGIANLNLGLIFEISGDRDSALVYYKEATKGNLDLDEDSYAKRKAIILTENPLTAEDIKLISYTNLFNSGYYKRTIDSLKIFLKDSLESDLKAEAYLLLSRAYYKLKRYNETISFAAHSIEIETETEKWIHPFAHYYAAAACFQLKKYMDAQLFLNLISDYSDYDFPLKLDGMRYALQRRLDKVVIKSDK